MRELGDAPERPSVSLSTSSGPSLRRRALAALALLGLVTTPTLAKGAPTLTPEGPAPPPAAPPQAKDAPPTSSEAPAPAPSDAPTASAAPKTPPEGPRPLPPPRIVREGPMPGAGDDERERAGLGLRRQSDGTYLYIDPYKRFTATFNQDGTVHFADRWKRPDNDNTQRGKCCGPPRGLFGPGGMQVTGPYEWIIALHGIDIYGRVKADLLARTREVRIALAITYNRELLGRRLAALEGELRAIWDASQGAAARRALLFQRWDECDEAFAIKAGEIPEEALSEMDRDRIAAAERARRQIEAFIRDKLPQKSKLGYSPAELAALNARRQSREPFAPYRSR